jgi:hypothetical protein
VTAGTLPHPFGGGIPFPWARPEAQALYDTLSRDVTVSSEIDMLAKTFAPGAAALNLGQLPGELWRLALTSISLADGLLALCARLAANQNRLAVAAAAQAVLDARAGAQRRLGRDGRLVVDRDELRAYLGELALEGSTVKVLLVRGDPHTGKSWSRHLFERTARDRGAKPVYLRSGMVATAAEVVLKLFSALGAAERIPKVDTMPDAWFRQVCLVLPGEAERFGQPLWIAVDDLGTAPDGTPLMDRQIRDFFDQMALTLDDSSTHQWFRLLLIHYPDGEVPTRWAQDIWKEDRTQPEHVTAEHVADVLREWRADHARTLLDDEIVTASQQVIARADAPLPPLDPRAQLPRLRRIHDEVQAELARLAGGNP